MIEVARLDDLDEGVPATVRADGRDVLVVRWRGEVFAVRDICPHQSLPLTLGRVGSRVAGTPGSPAVDPASPVIRCPYHSWEYGLRDGICVSNPSLRVRSYEVAVRDGRVFVDMGRARR